MCDICGGLSLSGMVVGRGDGEEMNLCEECAALVFPGLRDMMRHNCPTCQAENSRFN